MGNNEYRHDIDGLRAIAVLLVLVYHFDLTGVITGGFIGVDVFFVISGFLVTGVMMRDIDRGAFGLWAFYRRRVSRLFPALFFVSIATMIAGAILLYPREFKDLAGQQAATQVYASNFYFWKSINYFGFRAENVPFLHTWSLAVEEQFYLLFPIFMLAVGRFRHWKTLLVIGFFASLALCIALSFMKPRIAFYLLPTRAWELFAGALLALYWARIRIGPKTGQILGWAGLGVIILGAMTIDKRDIFPGFLAIIPVAGAVLMIVAGGSARGGWVRLLSAPPMAFMGKISYSLYIVHWPIVVFTAYVFGASKSYGADVAGFAASIVIASGMYFWIERPARRILNEWPKSKVFTAYAALSGAFIAVCTVVYGLAGAPERYSPAVREMLAYRDATVEDFKQCTQLPAALTGADPVGAPLTWSRDCRLGLPDAPVTWLLWGDSHAHALAPAMAAWLQSRGEAGVLSFSPGCPPLFDVALVTDAAGRCAAHNAGVRRAIESGGEFKRVMMVSTWRQHEQGLLQDTVGRADTPTAGAALLTRRLDAQMAIFRDAAVSVDLWLPLPIANKPVPYIGADIMLASRAVQGTQAQDQAQKSATTREEYDRLNAVLLAYASQNAGQFRRIIAPADVMCREAVCDFFADGAPLFADNNHPARTATGYFKQVLDGDRAAVDR